MRVDYGGDGVGGVVEPVYELEPQGDEQRPAQETEMESTLWFRHSRSECPNKGYRAIAGEAYSTEKQDYKGDGPVGMRAPLQIGTLWEVTSVAVETLTMSRTSF
jgi:hypothetical protein